MVTPKPKFNLDLTKIASITTIVVSLCYGIKFVYNIVYAPKANEASIKALTDNVNDKFKGIDKQFEGVNTQFTDIKQELGELRRMHLAVASTVSKNVVSIEENKTAIAKMPEKVLTLIPEEVKKKIPN